jgi:hypothetical protein
MVQGSSVHGSSNLKDTPYALEPGALGEWIGKK